MTQLIVCSKWQVTAQDLYILVRGERVAIPEFDFKKSKEDPKINFNCIL